MDQFEAQEEVNYAMSQLCSATPCSCLTLKHWLTRYTALQQSNIEFLDVTTKVSYIDFLMAYEAVTDLVQQYSKTEYYTNAVEKLSLQDNTEHWLKTYSSDYNHIFQQNWSYNIEEVDNQYILSHISFRFKVHKHEFKPVIKFYQGYSMLIS